LRRREGRDENKTGERLLPSAIRNLTLGGKFEKVSKGKKFCWATMYRMGDGDARNSS